MFFVSDPDIEIIPKIDARSWSGWSTSSCLVVGCLMFQYGETDLTIFTGEDASQMALLLLEQKNFDQAFDGILETPRKTLAISTSEKDVLLRMTVPTASTRVRIWTNHPTEPEKIIVLVD